MLARTLWGLLLIGWIGGAAAEPAALNPESPTSYTVQPGDTLWDIAARFLRDPWRWSEVWQANPQVENPNLLYPGDTITLAADQQGGQPALRIHRDRPIVKLSPGVRVIPLPKPVPTVPIDAVRPFLLYPLVVNKRELDRAAYVLANADGRLISGTGDKVYAKGLDIFDQTGFSVFRPGPALEDYGSSRVLGYEATHVADTELLEDGERVATLGVREAVLEIHPGDRVLPASDEEFEQNFLPRAPAMPIEGRVIALPGNTSRVGRYQVVVVNLGHDDGIAVGDVLAVYQTGIEAPDPHGYRAVALPDERAGLVMVFRTFDRVSYALVMQAVREVRLHDVVTNPD
jgi:LysM repeat protein